MIESVGPSAVEADNDVRPTADVATGGECVKEENGRRNSGDNYLVLAAECSENHLIEDVLDMESSGSHLGGDEGRLTISATQGENNDSNNNSANDVEQELSSLAVGAVASGEVESESGFMTAHQVGRGQEENP